LSLEGLQRGHGTIDRGVTSGQREDIEAVVPLAHLGDGDSPWREQGYAALLGLTAQGRQPGTIAHDEYADVQAVASKERDGIDERVEALVIVDGRDTAHPQCVADAQALTRRHDVARFEEFHRHGIGGDEYALRRHPARDDGLAHPRAESGHHVRREQRFGVPLTEQCIGVGVASVVAAVTR
jgi:hypothetical protein